MAKSFFLRLVLAQLYTKEMPMLTTDYFYRTIQSADFAHFSEQKRIIPVRLKTPFTEQSEWFCEEQNAWLPLASFSEQGIVNADGTELCGIPVEFAGNPDRPKSLELIADTFLPDFPRAPLLEEMDAAQMEAQLLYRWKLRRWKFNPKSFHDADGIQKDFAAATLLTDTDELTLTIRFSKIIREKNGEPTEPPRFEERDIVFDMKNGTVKIPLAWGHEKDVYVKDIQGDTYQEYDWHREKYITRRVTPAFRYRETVSALTALEKVLPKGVMYATFQKLGELVHAFTRVSIEAATSDKKTPLCAMYRLTLLPFAPDLCEVLFSEEFEERKARFSYKRTDSKVFKRFCRKMKIRNTKTLRKCYAIRPHTLLTAMRLRDCGFKDMNLYNRVIESKQNEAFIAELNRKNLAFFTQFSIKKRGQKATMNTLLRLSERNERNTNALYDFRDSLDMFARYFKHLPETLKKDILEDGFTTFNHDALSNLAYRYENKNITFTHTAEEKKLEDTIDGYEFRLPENSYQLCEIGTSLHNCVATYADAVEQKKCTIVYATKDGEYRLCIEVRKNEIHQERSNHNARPTEEERKVLNEWHVRHGLVGA